MKSLTSSMETALKTNLKDIRGYTKGINLLAQRMQKDCYYINSYINEEYLNALEDDAQSIINLVETIRKYL